MRRDNTRFLVILVVVLMGIGSRLVHTGYAVVDKYLGDALYAALSYLLLSLIWKQVTPAIIAGITAGLMVVIEVFQLTGIAYQFYLSGNLLLKVLAIVLGTHFGWWDLGAYVVGILGATVVDVVFLRTS